MVSQTEIISKINDLVPQIKSSPIVVNVERILQPITDVVRGNPIVSTAAISAGVTGLVAGATTIVKRKKSSKKKTTKKKKKTSTKRKKSTKSRRKKTSGRRKKGRRTPRTAGKGRDRSTRRIRYTKKGQPYVITRSGKAKFIKKSSAKRSHKRKGGRY